MKFNRILIFKNLIHWNYLFRDYEWADVLMLG